MAALLSVWLMATAAAQADPLQFQVTPAGLVMLHNPNLTPLDFIYYSIESSGSFLDGSNGVWTSIADTYDADNDGSIDDDGLWFELSDAADELTEATFTGDGGQLDAGQSVSLGLIWDNTGGPYDLSASLVELGGGFPAVEVVYQAAVGDYNVDGDIDIDDYTMWAGEFGSTTWLAADGNDDGIVDGADYTVWRDAFDAAMGSGSGAQAFAAAVPEPGTSLLLICGTMQLLIYYRSHR